MIAQKRLSLFYLGIGLLMGGAPATWGANTTKLKAKPKVIERVVAYDSGQLTLVEFEIGDPITKDEIVATLDDDDHKHRLKIATMRAKDDSAVRTAQSRLQIRKAQLKELLAQRRRQRISDHRISQAEAEVAIAQAALEKAESNHELAQLEKERAEKALEKRYLRAPIDGVVLEVSKIRGDMIGKGTVVARIGDPKEVRLSVNLPQKLIASVRETGSVPLKLANGQVVDAKVESIGGPVKGKPDMRQVQLVSNDHRTDSISLTKLIEVVVPSKLKDLIPNASPIPNPVLPPRLQ